VGPAAHTKSPPTQSDVYDGASERRGAATGGGRPARELGGHQQITLPLPAKMPHVVLPNAEIASRGSAGGTPATVAPPSPTHMTVPFSNRIHACASPTAATANAGHGSNAERDHRTSDPASTATAAHTTPPDTARTPHTCAALHATCANTHVGSAPVASSSTPGAPARAPSATTHRLPFTSSTAVNPFPTQTLRTPPTNARPASVSLLRTANTNGRPPAPGPQHATSPPSCTAHARLPFGATLTRDGCTHATAPAPGAAAPAAPAQIPQTVPPYTEEKSPRPHGEHAVARVPFWIVPGGHAAHVEAPATAEKLPASHAYG
jgi:hypothetical protein